MGRRRIGGIDRLVLLACLALAFASQYQPTGFILEHGLDWLGNPPYRGFVGAFLPHLLLYTTATACLCALFWLALARYGLVAPPRFGNVRQALLLGALGGLITFAAVLPVAWLSLPPGSLRWIPPDGWKIAGNVFSNFYEEFIYRGFILAGLRALVGFWPAALISSCLWAFLHDQYPIGLRIFIAFMGLGLCWLVRRTRSLTAPYVAHMLADLLGDSVIG